RWLRVKRRRRAGAGENWLFNTPRVGDNNRTQTVPATRMRTRHEPTPFLSLHHLAARHVRPSVGCAGTGQAFVKTRSLGVPARRPPRAAVGLGWDLAAECRRSLHPRAAGKRGA